MVEKSGVEKSGVEKSGFEMSSDAYLLRVSSFYYIYILPYTMTISVVKLPIL